LRQRTTCRAWRAFGVVQVAEGGGLQPADLDASMAERGCGVDGRKGPAASMSAERLGAVPWFAMRVSESQKLLFVHVPKTGGVSVEKALEREVPDIQSSNPARHLGLKRIYNMYPETRKYWSFGFVRNPWRRMVSWYEMIVAAQASAEAGDPRAAKMMSINPIWAGVAALPDFEAFIMQGTEQFAWLRRPQIAWLTTRAGRRVDFIGRTENFAHDLCVVLERIGATDFAVPHCNTRSYGDWRAQYTPATRDKVATLFARDIAEWGYTFDLRPRTRGSPAPGHEKPASAGRWPRSAGAVRAIMCVAR
jgi:hypothetical protein